MTATTEDQTVRGAPAAEPAASRSRRLQGGLSRFMGFHVFSSLTRRIVVLNLAALVVLVSGILYLNQFRAGLTDARVASLLVQGEIIAGALGASSTMAPSPDAHRPRPVCSNSKPGRTHRRLTTCSTPTSSASTPNAPRRFSAA